MDLIDDLEIAETAKEEFEIAYSSFTEGLSSKLCYVQQTIQGISTLLNPLQDVIRNNLIQAILDQNINDVEPNTQNTNYQPEFQIIYDFFVISQSSENTRF